MISTYLTHYLFHPSGGFMSQRLWAENRSGEAGEGRQNGILITKLDIDL